MLLRSLSVEGDLGICGMVLPLIKLSLLLDDVMVGLLVLWYGTATDKALLTAR